MTISSFLRRAFCAYVAAGVAVACSGCQASHILPAQAPVAALPQVQSVLPNNTLIYAVGDQSSFIFKYPQGKLVHRLPATGLSACTDHAGSVFVTQVGSIARYEHGGTKPAETYKVAGSAYSCSISPKTHDLAAVVFCLKRCGEEVVVMGEQRRHRRHYHVASLTSLLYCAYDDRGNLFVDGYNGSQFALAELTSGATQFVGISLKSHIQYAAQIQWDGTYLAIETRVNPVIYRVSISGSDARIVGRTVLDGVGTRASQSWIRDGTIAVPSASYNKRPIEIFFWNYPAGGQPTKIIKGFLGSGKHPMIDGVTLSVTN